MTSSADRTLLVEQSRLARQHTADARAQTSQLIADSQRCCEQTRLLLATTRSRGEEPPP